MGLKVLKSGTKLKTTRKINQVEKSKKWRPDSLMNIKKMSLFKARFFTLCLALTMIFAGHIDGL